MPVFWKSSCCRRQAVLHPCITASAAERACLLRHRRQSLHAVCMVLTHVAFHLELSTSAPCLQVGAASPAQPLPAWIRGAGVMLRVTAMDPPVPVARLVPGTEIYVAPRLRVRPAAAVAASGNLLPAAQQRGSDGNGAHADHRQGCSAASEGPQREGDAGEDAAPPLQAVLRVQPLSAAATAAAQQQAQQHAEGQPLPAGMQRVLASAATLARCGLRPGDWVRLSGRGTRSLVKFASLAASELAAPGHLALSAEQSEWAGAPPFSPIRLQRLTHSQRQLIIEAAELQGGGNGSNGGGSSKGATEQRDDCQPANGDGLQDQQQQQPKRRQAVEMPSVASLASASWLRPGTEQALRHLLPILGFTPRSLLQVGTPTPYCFLPCKAETLHQC